VANDATRAGRVFIVSDALDWLDKQVALRLPDAIRTTDVSGMLANTCARLGKSSPARARPTAVLPSSS